MPHYGVAQTASMEWLNVIFLPRLQQSSNAQLMVHAHLLREGLLLCIRVMIIREQNKPRPEQNAHSSKLEPVHQELRQ
jgi:hypothetical protein